VVQINCTSVALSYCPKRLSAQAIGLLNDTLGSGGGCTVWKGGRKTRYRDEEKCYRQKEITEIKLVQEEQNVEKMRNENNVR
jgi:hypothetical protein